MSALRRALGEITKVLESAPGLARVLSPAAARALLEGEKLDPLVALDALDELAFALRRARLRAKLLPPLDAARNALAPALEDLDLTPALGPLPRDLDAVRDPRVAALSVPWPARAGTIVALERRGRSGRKALLHVASGAPRTTRLDVLEAALVAIEAATPSREDYERLTRLIDDSERDDPRANSEAAVRFATGCIERARAIAKAREVALAFLGGAGITPLALAAGERFDADKHPASAFERRLVAGSTGRVVATELTGFRDANGVVLSRAIVAVGG